MHGTRDRVKDKSETKSWKNRVEVSVIIGAGRDTVRQ